MRFLLLISLIFIFSLLAFGQAGGAGRSIYDPSPDLQKQRDIYEKTGRDRLGMISHKDGFYFPGRALTKEEKQEVQRIKALVAVDPEDLNKYKTFLKESDTGIFRLFPDFDCESKFVVKINENCLNVAPGISTYSFRRKGYASVDLNYFDIQLKGSEIISKGFLVQGIITRLGDVPLENVSLTSSGLDFLVNFKPQREIQAVRNQYQQISDGIKSGGYTYGNVVKAEDNTTYALRVVAYRKSLITVNRFFLNVDDKRFATLSFDRRKDLILAFRVIRREDDGRLTILWKQLSREDSPSLIYPKGERFSDFKPKY